MRVILREDIQKLGEAGDIVTVKRGYARNYLIPNKLALEATEGNLKTFKDIARAQESRSEKEKGSAEILAQKLAAVRLVIPVEVSDENQLYGSVTTQMIRDALAEDGIDIQRRLIDMPSPIKELGTFDISIRLHREVAPTISVVVERTTDREAGSVDWVAAVDVEEAKEAAAEATETAGLEEVMVDEVEPEKAVEPEEAAEAAEPEEEVVAVEPEEAAEAAEPEEEVVAAEPEKEVVAVEPVKEVVAVEPVEEVVAIEPVEEVVAIEPVEEDAAVEEEE